MRPITLIALLLTSVSVQGQEVFKPTGRYATDTVQVVVTAPVRYVQWPGWGIIDLETYNRNCNCNMCVSIRSRQQVYRAELAAYNAYLAKQTPVTASQESTPYEVVTQLVDQLQLKPDEVVADLGCGDGRILIETVKRYKCKGIGVEIDEKIATKARQKVKAAGLDNQITIITGDALQFNPEEHNVTAITAFLYPELLKRLMPKFKHDKVMVVATPYHEVPGLTMVKHGNVYVWRRKVTQKRLTNKDGKVWYLVSEPWCSACKQAKSNFLKLGWPKENVISSTEYYRRTGKQLESIPFLFSVSEDNKQ